VLLPRPWVFTDKQPILAGLGAAWAGPLWREADGSCVGPRGQAKCMREKELAGAQLSPNLAPEADCAQAMGEAQTQCP
jgi:hypothetical protein